MGERDLFDVWWNDIQHKSSEQAYAIAAMAWEGWIACAAMKNREIHDLREQLDQMQAALMEAEAMLIEFRGH